MPGARPAAHPPSQVLDTPDTPTIDTLSTGSTARLGTSFTAGGHLEERRAEARAGPADDWEPLVVGVPGDREVDLKRVGGQLEPAEVEPADPPTSTPIPALVKGYIGPQELPLGDPLRRGSRWWCRAARG